MRSVSTSRTFPRPMKRLGRAFFVVFYFAATIGVASERCARMADRVGHSTTSEFERVESPTASFVKHLPYFSHAKKGKSAIADVSAEVSRVPQLIVWKFETRPIVESPSAFWREAPGSRAPPALSSGLIVPDRKLHISLSGPP